MKKLFANLSVWSYNLIDFFLGCLTIGLTLIVNIQVVARYVLKVSIGGMEELPIFFMIVSVWIAAVLVARKDAHFKVELVDMVVKNKRAVATVKAFVKLLTAVAIGIFTVISFTYVRGTLQGGDITAGLEIPVWILQAVIPLSTAFMALFYGIQFVNETKAIIKWRS